MKKYIYKKSLFAWIDMLKAKRLPKKIYKKINQKSDINIKTNYHVNELARKLHPYKINVKVNKLTRLDNDCIKIRLTNLDNDTMPYFRAGQYISIIFKVNGVEISRPYSISSSPYEAINNNYYEVIVKCTLEGFISQYIATKLKLHDKLIIQGPFGDFYHDDLRDANHIIAITRGVGITPFLSMAKAIVEQSEDFALTIIISAFNLYNIVEYQTLSDLVKKANNKIKLVLALSNQTIQKENCYNQEIDTNLIKKYFKEQNSIFLCGSKSLYRRTYQSISALNLPNKYIRYEKSNQIGKPTDYSDYKNLNNKISYKIKVNNKGEIHYINARFDETILVALQKAKLTTISNCLRGTCGWCRFKLIKGNIYTPLINLEPRKADIKNHIYFTCSSFPTNDLEIELF